MGEATRTFFASSASVGRVQKQSPVAVDADSLGHRPVRIRRVDSQRKFANDAIAAVLRGGRGEFSSFARYTVVGVVMLGVVATVV